MKPEKAVFAVAAVVFGWTLFHARVHPQQVQQSIGNVHIRAADKITGNYKVKPFQLKAVGNVEAKTPDGTIRCATLTIKFVEDDGEQTVTPLLAIAEGDVHMEVHYLDEAGQKQTVTAQAQRAELDHKESKLILTGAPSFKFGNIMPRIQQGEGKAGRITIWLDTGNWAMEDKAELDLQLKGSRQNQKAKPTQQNKRQ